MSHCSLRIADHFLKLANSDGKSLTPLKLMKLVYIAHGWMLGLYGRPLIKEQVQAWKYGPVIPELYQEIKKYKDQPVSIYISDSDIKLSNVESKLIKKVYDVYKKYSPIELSSMTHEEGSPWKQVYNKWEYDNPIPNHIIGSYYKIKADSNNG